MNNSEVIQDFRRRYERTYVFLANKKTGSEDLVFIQEVAESDSKIATISLEGLDIGVLRLNLGSDGFGLRFKYPPVGVFQYGRDACIFRRRPQRQYRRGVCNDNSSLYNTTREICGNHINFSLKTVTAAYKAATFPVGIALDMLNKKNVRSVALPNNFSLALSMVDEKGDHFLFHGILPVARVSCDGKVTHIYEESYKNLLDFIEMNYGNR
jgi:hypothetical protein